MPKKFLCILFYDVLQADDIKFIRGCSPDEPGLAQIDRARLGQPRPEAPNSMPLDSRTGARLGYVADMALLEAPYNDTFLME